jgi:hypothetical protein
MVEGGDVWWSNSIELALDRGLTTPRSSFDTTRDTGFMPHFSFPQHHIASHVQPKLLLRVSCLATAGDHGASKIFRRSCRGLVPSGLLASDSLTHPPVPATSARSQTDRCLIHLPPANHEHETALTAVSHVCLRSVDAAVRLAGLPSGIITLEGRRAHASRPFAIISFSAALTPPFETPTTD